MAGLAAKNGSNLVEAIQPTTRTRSVRPQEFVPAPKYGYLFQGQRCHWAREGARRRVDD